MIKYKELPKEEREHITYLFSVWLKDYTDEVIIKVMAKSEQIINNSHYMEMLEKLAKFTNEEYGFYESGLQYLFENYDEFKEFKLRYDVVADSYRAVLYDLIIKEVIDENI